MIDREATSRFCTVGKIRLHYHEAGDGEPLLCIHGAGPGASGWNHFQKNFEALSRNYRTFLLDLPGWGRSDTISWDDPTVSFAGLMEAFVTALGIRNVHVMGWSMGSGIAFKFALNHPDRVRRLVLLGGAGIDVGVFLPAPSEGRRVLNAFYANPSRSRISDFLRTLVYDENSISEGLIDQWWLAEERRASLPPHPSMFYEVADDLAKVGHETLIVRGLDDRFSASDSALQLLRRMPRSEVHLFGRSGHWCHWEHAGRLNALVTDFLRGEG